LMRSVSGCSLAPLPRCTVLNSRCISSVTLARTIKPLRIAGVTRLNPLSLNGGPLAHERALPHSTQIGWGAKPPLWLRR
jgi:hypothetical protein